MHSSKPLFLHSIVAKDANGKTPLHLSKTSRILNILLSQVKAGQLTELEKPKEVKMKTTQQGFVIACSIFQKLLQMSPISLA